ncbi:MAG: RNA-binding protein [Proteobacteria bacterium]|nr:RNA-binding protein [Pseudomonadota bacterium]
MARNDHVAERRCILTGSVLPQAALLRFVVGPDGLVVPDIKGSLPGRGIWLTAHKDSVEQAQKKGAFNRAAKQTVNYPDDLSGLIDRQLEQGCLNLLGLARKAGDLVAGFEKVKAWLGKGTAMLLISASDAAADGRRKLQQIDPALPIITLFSGDQLSLALGRENVIHAAFRSGGLARRFVAEAGRLAVYRQTESQDGAQPKVDIE